jgi:hypothetical protein
MYGFHCADFNGTRNHSRRIIGSSPSQWKSPCYSWKSPCCLCPKKARQVRSNGESTLMIFMLRGRCSTGISSSRPNDLTSTRPTTGFFATSEGQVPPQRPNQWRNQNWLMHLENSPVHTALWVRQFLVAKSWLWFHNFLTRIMWRLAISPSFRK